ncbi:unnamed protein product [Staurois parvus]|uniref:Uncharacterized protein n=1 Tax=Staurois parvus TaxID=386267 RepID=A0ABN9H3Z1_9NEOB|nr:unnamed protein product [Staurois parvus]
MLRHTILYIGGQTLGEAGTCDVTQSFTLEARHWEAGTCCDITQSFTLMAGLWEAGTCCDVTQSFTLGDGHM